MQRKIIAGLLAVLMCLMFVGCSANDAPDGMKSVTVDGEPFVLYVPTNWTDNTVSGISGAYFNVGLEGRRIMVSARYVTAPSEELTLDSYVTELSDSYAQLIELYSLSAREPSVLGGQDAQMLVYTYADADVEYTARQIVTKYAGDFIALTFYSPKESYEAYLEQFDSIAKVFKLCEKEAVDNDFVTDKNTPEGMKIASSDKIEYRLYVPTSWVCNSQSPVSQAYYPVSGKPNVTVTSYSPDGDMTAEEYFAKCDSEFREKLDGYEMISSTDRTVARKDAKVYTYRVVIGGTSFQIMQTVFVYNGMVYSITYTALPDSFDTYLGDVNKILDSFIFR